MYQQVSSLAATSNGILYETASTSGTPKQLAFSARRPEQLLRGPTVSRVLSLYESHCNPLPRGSLLVTGQQCPSPSDSLHIPFVFSVFQVNYSYYYPHCSL